MNDLFFTTGQAAKELNLPQSRIRALCKARAIACELTDGNQFRIPTSEIERLKREGVPAAPRPLPGSERSSRTRPAGLLGQPSHEVIASAEGVVKLENEVKSISLRRQKEEGLDWFRDREARKEKAQRQRDAEQHERERLAEQEEERRIWESTWIHEAIGRIPQELPVSARLEVDARAREVLSRLTPDTAESLVEQLIDAAIEKALEPWLVADMKKRAAKKACEDVPLFSDESTRRRLYSIAIAAVDKLSPSTSYEDLRAFACQSIAGEVASIEHRKRCQEMVDRVSWKLNDATSKELDEARERVSAALARLPVGASTHQLEETRDSSLEPTRKAIALRHGINARKQMIQHARLGLSIPFGLSSRLKEKLVGELEEELDSIQFPSASQLEKVRDRITNRFSTIQRLIDGGIALIEPYITKLEREWQLSNLSRESLRSAVRFQLEEELDGAESEQEVSGRVKRLVRDELGIDE